MESILSFAPWIWAAIVLITIIIELFSVDTDAFWFTIGAGVSFVLSLFKVNVVIQLSIFIGVTALLLFTIGRLIKKIIITKNIPQTSDSLIGREILVLESANEFENGSGVIDDVVWTIVCQAGVKADKGQHAIIAAIDGNKLIVVNKESI